MKPLVLVAIIAESVEWRGHAFAEHTPLTNYALENGWRELVDPNVREQKLFVASAVLVYVEPILVVIED